jgi:hypothetical protein
MDFIHPFAHRFHSDVIGDIFFAFTHPLRGGNGSLFDHFDNF